MRKLLCRLFLVSLLIFSTISHTAMSFTILNIKSANSLEPIHDDNPITNGIFCNSYIADMYFNNDFLFLEKSTDYHELALEIYDVSIPQEMKLVKTSEHNGTHYYASLTGNVNYTFLNIEERNLERAVVAFDVNSSELAHVKIILPDSNYTINQIVADNEYLYLVREPYNWTLDWQVEKYKINNPFSLSLVNNESVSKYSYLYAKDNNSFIINGKDINNWTNPYGSDVCSINDVYYENNRLLILMRDQFNMENNFEGLLIIDVTNNESYQVIASYPLSLPVNIIVIENNIFISLLKEIIVLETTDYVNFEKISSYSFGYILGTLELMCYGNDLLFIGKLSCSGRECGTKEEDKVSLVILSVENPREIVSVFPEGFNNKFQFFIDGGLVPRFIVKFVLPVIGSASIISVSIVLIMRRRNKREKGIE